MIGVFLYVTICMVTIHFMFNPSIQKHVPGDSLIMTKNSVLTILRNENKYISGEAISRMLGISRAAVNTAVKSLRAEGYDILSSTNKGYYLNAVPNCLSTSELSAYLPKQRMQSVLCIDSVDSTNNRLRELALSGAPDGQIVIANEQQSGRGRRGRNFLSPKGKGIYLSMLFHPANVPTDVIEITAWTAVAVSNAIQTVCGIRPEIKWVNDLLVNQKKICGILTEMSVESESGYIQYIIIGIGVNVNEMPADFPEDLRKSATSLSAETGSEYSLAHLASEIIKELDLMRNAWPQEKQAYLDAYRKDNITIGKEISVIDHTGEKQATATSVNDDFSLNVLYPDGSTEKLSSGEVSIRGLYGKD